MAKIPTNITELDFFAIKEQFKDYLKTQTAFRDYNFEGSNMSIFLDVLAYNTFQNNFYTNMAISEMFLDTAQLKNSIVSHAKELNYLPKSSKSAKAIVRVSFTDTNGAATIAIPAGTKFTSTAGGTTYNFVTEQTFLARKTTVSGSTATYVADNVEIFEGQIFREFEQEGYFVEDSSYRCVLSSENVDVSSIRVTQDDGEIEYLYNTDIFGVEPLEKVFYLEPHFNDRYAIVFGRNVYGFQPEPDEKLQIQYRVCNEDEPNGASKFATTFKNSSVTTIENASGGAKKETLESIRFFAPRSIQIQERAVTARDYEILLKQRFSEIQAVSVYGGEDLEPPQFGKVAISVVLDGNRDLSDSKKNDFKRYLDDKTPLTIEPIFVNSEFMYVDAEINVYYSYKQTTKNEAELEQIIRTVISDYNSNNLDAFGATLRTSKLSGAIDDADISILSNSLELKSIIEYSPPILLPQNPTFKFGSALIKPYPLVLSNGFVDFKPSIKSSVFSYNGICALLQDNGSGIMQIISSDVTNTRVLNANAGTVDYNTGIVSLINFTTDGYTGRAIKILAKKKEADIIAPKNRLLQLRNDDIRIIFNEASSK